MNKAVNFVFFAHELKIQTIGLRSAKPVLFRVEASGLGAESYTAGQLRPNTFRVAVEEAWMEFVEALQQSEVKVKQWREETILELKKTGFVYRFFKFQYEAISRHNG